MLGNQTIHSKAIEMIQIQSNYAPKMFFNANSLSFLEYQKCRCKYISQGVGLHHGYRTY